jgi:photosynthetic reaction center cytochrome c subunit
MANRKSICLWIALLLIVLTLPLLAAQAPERGAQGQAPGQRGGGGGGGRGGGAAPVNLQVLPKDTPRAQVIPVMQTFTMGLGVMCEHCHVPQAGAQPGANGQIPMDFASDDKQEKKTARVMMKMVMDINAKLGSELGKPAASVVQVQCITCHRGSSIPKTQ